MGSASGWIELEADSRTVWGYITNPDNFHEYVYGYAGGKAVTPNKTGIGAKYEWYGKLGPLKLRSVEEIVEWRDGEWVAYRGSMAGISFDSSMQVQDSTGGGTKLTVSIKYRLPAIVRWLLDGVAEGLMRTYVAKSLDSLTQALRAPSSRDR